MMKKLYTLILLLFCFTSSFAQSEFHITEGSKADCSLETRLSKTDVIFLSNAAPDNNEIFNLLKEYYENRGIRVIEYINQRDEYYSGWYFDALTKYAVTSEDYTHTALTATAQVQDGALRVYYQDIYQLERYEPKYYFGGMMFPTINKIKERFKSAISMFPEQIANDVDYQLVRPLDRANWSKEQFVSYAKALGLDTFEGVYKDGEQEFYVKKYGSDYYLVAANNYPYIEGDVVGKLTPTATPNLFLGEWNEYICDKRFNYSFVINHPNVKYYFSEIGLEAIISNYQQISLIKTWPTADELEDLTETKWSGSGWALNGGYIVTNEHVVKGASQISVTIGGNKYPATVVATDTQNDLAIIKTDKNDIKPPYSIREERCDIGERCYVLGYPLTQQLGNEIRLTDGLISARSGYQGNANQYQISAPVQPGNSGCPLFDENGRIIGIVNSGIPSADNVGFAIKTSSLLNLLDSCSLDSFIPTHGNSRFRDHVEEITQYVYLIECNNR